MRNGRPETSIQELQEHNVQVRGKDRFDVLAVIRDHLQVLNIKVRKEGKRLVHLISFEGRETVDLRSTE